MKKIIERKYVVYVLFGDPAAEPIWSYQRWGDVAPSLDPIFASARKRPTVSPLAYLPQQKGQVKFGLVSWNDAGHQKWTLNSPKNSSESASWLFSSVEVYAPSRKVSMEEGLAPDVYFTLINELASRAFNVAPTFNPLILLAVADDIATTISPDVDNAIATLSEATNSLLTCFKKCTWGQKAPRSGWNGDIGDLAMSGLFRSNNPHAKPPSVDLLDGEWETL